jgi:DNA-binding CsgD family transcriptional regulator
LYDVESGNILLESKQTQEDRVHFTKREKEILLKIKQGMNSKSIAELFDCSKHTVDTHRRKMLKKTGSKNTMELVNFGIRTGII